MHPEGIHRQGRQLKETLQHPGTKDAMGLEKGIGRRIAASQGLRGTDERNLQTITSTPDGRHNGWSR